jgi:hypothetical protein
MNSHTLAALQEWQAAEAEDKKTDKAAEKPAQGTSKKES